MRAIITGISGQDGYYLARQLIKQGFHILGLSTNEQRAKMNFSDIDREFIKIKEFDYYRENNIVDIINDFKPDHIYNLASFATGSGMFNAPFEMSRLNGTFVLDILEAIKSSPRAAEIRFCQASSSEMFGYVSECPQNETSPLRPKSPYGAAKQYAHTMISIYRQAYGLHCVSAILYNHESVRRSAAFVTKKIARGAVRIKRRLENTLELGSLSIARDWGYAPEYTEAMALMAASSNPVDYVIATGKRTTIGDIVDICFAYLGLDPGCHVVINPKWARPVESLDLLGDATKIHADLGWRARRDIKDIMLEMVDFEMHDLEK